MQIDEKLSEIISIVQSYIVSDKTLEERISLLENIEDVIRDVNIYKEKFEDSVDIKEIRKKWLSGISMSDIVQHENAVNIVTQHYSFNMPWVLNGISKKMKKQNLIEEADTIEELAILVELGLPNINQLKSIKQEFAQGFLPMKLPTYMMMIFGKKALEHINKI